MPARARVVSIEELRHDFYHLVLLEKRIAREAVPGQFVHIRIGKGLAPFLRRPFSLAGVFAGKGTLKILFRVVGEGTKILSTAYQGQEIDCLGPLGTGFRLSNRAGTSVLLAGGLGVAPLLYLAQTLVDRDRQVILFYGAVSESELLPVERFLAAEVQVYFVTEDGSSGYKGLVTGAFEEELKKGFVPAEIFACGPRAMLKELSLKNRKWAYPLQISLEERMACGIGACQGCVVGGKGSGKTYYQRVCRDGPVFCDEEVGWSGA